MKKAKYIYKLKSKFKKKPELLAKYGFNPYVSENEEDNEVIYAVPIVLSEDSSIFKYLKRAVEKIYSKATTAEREEFKGLEFQEILTEKQQRDYLLVMTDEIRKEMSECQLCIPNSGLGEWCLFINAPDRIEYYNTDVLNECAKDIIDQLLKDKAIYKSRVRQ